MPASEYQSGNVAPNGFSRVEDPKASNDSPWGQESYEADDTQVPDAAVPGVLPSTSPN